MDTVVEKYKSQEQKDEAASKKSFMDLYNDDKGERVRQMLEGSGFKGVKIWEQPMNVHYKDGEDFV